MNRFRKIIKIVVSFIIVILLWQIVFKISNFNEALFPSPASVYNALIEMAKSGKLVKHIEASLIRFAIGYILAVISAIVLGLILGRLNKLFEYINPVIQLIRPISPMAWMPFIVLWFGIGDVPAIFIIFIAAFFPVLLATVSAVKNINNIYLKVGKNFGIKQPYLLTKIIFPASFPQIVSGLHLALGTAWVFLVAGEMVGAQSGLGYLIIDCRNNLRADLLVGTIIVIGVLGLILDTLIGYLEKSMLVCCNQGREVEN